MKNGGRGKKRTKVYTGRAPQVVPRYGSSLKKNACLKGPCSSCERREGVFTPIFGQMVSRILCDACALLRRQRIARAREAFFAAIRKSLDAPEWAA